MSKNDPQRAFDVAVVNPERLSGLRSFPEESSVHRDLSDVAERVIRTSSYLYSPQIKNEVRDLKMDLYDARRKTLWKVIYECMARDQVETNERMFRETRKTLYPTEESEKSPPHFQPCIDPKLMNTYGLNENGKTSVRRVIHCMTYNGPDIQFCPVAFPLVAIFRHFLGEEETYGLIMSLLESKEKSYLCQSRQREHIRSMALMELTLKFAKKSFYNLESQIRERSGEKLEDLFLNYSRWLFGHLPLSHLVRIVDCFLIEGEKILYRVCIVLIKSFVKAANTRDSIQQLGLLKAFDLYCKDIKISPSSLLDKAFAIRNFSQNDVKRAKAQVEVDKIGRSIESSKSHDAVPPTDFTDGSLSRAQDFSIPSLPPEAVLLNFDFLHTIWKWLPARIALSSNFELAFSSNIHGYSLTTFYNRSEIFEQTLLIIKSVSSSSNSSDNSSRIFGAYCSASWAERNRKDDRGNRQTYFGTGETFLFTLTPISKRYPWVGPDPHNNRANELFMAASNEMVSVGGGDGSGIFIDGTLTFGKSEKCSTFNNEPLSGDEKDFKISLIEVYGFNKSE